MIYQKSRTFRNVEQPGQATAIITPLTFSFRFPPVSLVFWIFVETWKGNFVENMLQLVRYMSGDAFNPARPSGVITNEVTYLRIR